ncbi:MAG TPA: AAA family ATPase, partial [Aquihabitans sp.]|nr:AAA family ATPase [Aquihabitans sp.]
MVETTRAQLPAGVVTFLLTDVAGSTEQWEAHPEEMTTVIARHYALLHAAISDHDGVCPVEQGEGDSVVAAFARGSDAVRAALDAQRALAEEPWPDGIDIEVRMALHTGEARLRDEGNYAGETIIRTARLRALAHGSQVIASRACVDLVADLLPPEATWIDLGSYRLRNLERPEQVFQLAHPALRRDFPPLRGLDVVGNNLPTQLTPFIGREAELAQLHALLDDVRLLTLTGSGGCGKTRLALQAAADRVERHRDGVWYVELAPLGETSSVLGTLADVLRVHGSAEQSLLDLVVERLRDARALLVVDNCEHLLDDAAEVIGALLRSCPPLQIVATSRQPLNLPGEVTWRVPSLGAPGPDDAADLDSLDQYDSVRLFVDRAVRARPNFAVTNENAASVAGICSRLDGIPLAIELAAARVRSLPVERIAEGLDDRFRLLRGGSATLLPRQQTLLASVEWSHQLLDEQERTLLRRLALFCGGFTLDAAEAVAAFEPLDPYAVLDHLTNLVDRSLVLLDDEGAEPRYRMLETIKQFSLARLEESDERTDVADRHLAHYAALAAAVAPHLETGAQLAERPRLAVEHDNLRAALVHAASRPEPMPLARLASDLTLYWVQTAHYADADEWLALAAERLGPDAGALLPRLLWGRGYVVYYFGDLVRSTALADAAIVAARAAGDPGIEARAIDLRSDALQFVDPIGTIPALEEGLDLARQAGDRWATV